MAPRKTSTKVRGKKKNQRLDWGDAKDLAKQIRANQNYKSGPVQIGLATGKNGSTGLGELGTSGLVTQYGFVQEAYNPSLYWPGVRDVYKKIMTSTPEIVMVGHAFQAWARNVFPVIDLPEKPTDDDKRYQEFMYQDFENMEGGFGKFCEALVGNVPFYGWGWWEILPSFRDPKWVPPPAVIPGIPAMVPQKYQAFVGDSLVETEVLSVNPKLADSWRSQYDDGLIGVRRLAWRDPGTLERWEFDDAKHLRGMWQQDFPRGRVLLPLDDGKRQSLHMTFGDPNNPEGRTPLEAVWRLERLKYGLEVVQGIGFEHAAGFLSVTKTIDGTLTPEDKQHIKEAAMTILSAHEGNYAYWPFGLEGKVNDVSFAASSAILEAIKYYGILMLSVYTMEWIGLNTMTQHGARAAQADVTQAAVFTFNSMMDGFAAQYDEQVGRKLYEWNKDAFPNLTRRPRVKFSNVTNRIDLTALGGFWKAIDGIVPLGLEDFKAFRQATGFMPTNTPDVDDIANELFNATDEGEPAATTSALAPTTPEPGPSARGKAPQKSQKSAATIAQQTKNVIRAAEIILASQK